MSRSILLIEDEPGLVLTLKDRLTREGYEVDSAQDGNLGLASAMRGLADLIILDLMLPGRGGLDICRDLRQKGIETPILMLTARGQTVDKVLGLKLGADDYLTKPFEMPELLARVEVLMRRNRNAAGPGAAFYNFGNIEVDLRRASATRGGEPVALSTREFELLRYFIEHRSVAISRDELLSNVWHYDAGTTTRTVDVHVAWLRQKLEDDAKRPQWIMTVHGLGYKFLG
jgi:two-component system, OmpR family, alkaline phosphatase synthesis response regulator PhoP